MSNQTIHVPPDQTTDKPPVVPEPPTTDPVEAQAMRSERRFLPDFGILLMVLAIVAVLCFGLWYVLAGRPATSTDTTRPKAESKTSRRSDTSLREALRPSISLPEFWSPSGFRARS